VYDSCLTLVERSIGGKVSSGPSTSGRPSGLSLQRVVTVFGNHEFAAIRAYCKRKRISLYSLAKTAIREYVKRHS
jgi:hypothetical protein